MGEIDQFDAVYLDTQLSNRGKYSKIRSCVNIHSQAGNSVAHQDAVAFFPDYAHFNGLKGLPGRGIPDQA